jgi:uroporphyrinogen-III decarboxylase
MSVSTNQHEDWAQLTPEQKRQRRLGFLTSTQGMSFASPGAEEAYKVSNQRFVDAYNLKEPDRVPVVLPVGNLPLTMAGLNRRATMYDHEKAIEATIQFNEKYGEELEYFAMPDIAAGGALDILDYKVYAWPGHGIPENAGEWQYIEGEYMMADEYDDLIRDPSDFWLRTYLPRIFGVLGPLNTLLPLTNIIENINVWRSMFLAKPEVQDMLRRLIDAGKEYQKAEQVIMKYGGDKMAWGFSGVTRGFCKAPFDTLGDTLRGTSGIMMDMFRYPDKLLKALDVIADISIDSILKSPDLDRMTMVSYPLHKGADGWMSQEQFDTFYWPSLRKVMDAFIQEGLLQSLFAEGSFNTRLESINVFPKGALHWYFDRTDMAAAKKLLGDGCCIQGNVPSSMIVTGSPQEVKEYCRNLIDVCGKGGGFILSCGTITENPKLENLRAMMEAVREYGVYKK